MKFTIRKAEVKDGAGIADVKVDSWRETYTGLMPDEILSKLSKPKTQKVWEKIIADGEETDHTIVAEVDGKIVGFLNGGAAREPEYGYKGELCAVYLLEEFQGNGIGKALFLHLTDFLKSIGVTSMYLWVLAGNSTSLFYEGMGGKRGPTKDEIVRDTPLKHEMYYWDDLNSIKKRDEK